MATDDIKISYKDFSGYVPCTILRVAEGVSQKTNKPYSMLEMATNVYQKCIFFPPPELIDQLRQAGLYHQGAQFSLKTTGPGQWVVVPPGQPLPTQDPSPRPAAPAQASPPPVAAGRGAFPQHTGKLPVQTFVDLGLYFLAAFKMESDLPARASMAEKMAACASVAGDLSTFATHPTPTGPPDDDVPLPTDDDMPGW